MCKPIETWYKGYHFRSRLEARWAVFFDALGWAWLYEDQGFILPSGAYLPDFFLPGVPAFCEVKPTEPTDEEIRLCSELAVSEGSDVLILAGQPWPGEHGVRFIEAGGYIWPERNHTIRDGATNDPRLLVAYRAARSARFEHGQHGRTDGN